jgi:hypothetical protein
LDFGLRESVRADEKLTAFVELERAVCIHLFTATADDLGC